MAVLLISSEKAHAMKPSKSRTVLLQRRQPAVSHCHWQRKLRVEQLEARQMLSIGADWDRPEAKQADSNHGTFQGEIIYVNFRGAEDITYRGPVTVTGLDIPLFSARSIGLGGQEATIEDEVMKILRDEFASAGVTITTERPLASVAYSTIFVGGGDARFRIYGGNYYGLAEDNDVGNARPDDNAFVFSDTVLANLAEPSRATLTQALSEVIGHEGNRLLGRIPVDDKMGTAVGLDAVAAQALSFFQYPIVPAGGDGRSGAVVTQHFGEGFGTNRGHLGTDIRGSTRTPVHAIADGKVTQVIDLGYDSGWGKVLIIEHKTTDWGWDKDVYSMYAHVDNIVVSKGQYVHRGDVICQVGPTAKGSTGPNLRLEIRSGSEAWWRAGPGYRGHDFNRLSSSTVTRSDYPNLTWHDPEKVIGDNLYPVSVTTSMTRATAGNTVTVETHIAVSAFSKDDQGRLDLAPATLAGSLVGLPDLSDTVHLGSPDSSRGQTVGMSAGGSDVIVLQTYHLPASGAGTSVVRPYEVFGIGSGTPINIQAPTDLPIDPMWDPLGAFDQQFPSLTPTPREWLRAYADSMHPDVAGLPTQELLIMTELARRAVQIDRALPAANQPNATPEQFAKLLRDAFGDTTVRLDNPWDASLPTVVLVHGIMNYVSFHTDVGARMALGAISAQGTREFNVISFFWGTTGLGNGLDRSLDDVIRNASSDYDGNDEYRNLKGAIDLHLLIKLLDRVYGPSAAPEKIDIIAHSEGTVVVAGALSLSPPSGPQNGTYDINQTLFIGANLDTNAVLSGHELDGIRTQNPQLLRVVNLTSLSDNAVIVGVTEAGAGHAGFDAAGEATLNAGLSPDNFLVRSVPVDDATILVNDRVFRLLVQHTGTLQTHTIAGTGISYATDGWWDWILHQQETEDFIGQGLKVGFENAAAENLIGGRFEAFHAAAPENTFGPEDPIIVSKTLVASAGGFDVAVGGVQYVRSCPTPGKRQVVPTLTRVDLRQSAVFQGELVIASAVGAADADGRVVRLEAFLDANGNLHPDAGELVAVDYNPAGGLRVAIDTRDLAFGTYTLIFRVADDEGNYSELVTAYFQVLDPNAPPPQLPSMLPPETKPDYAIIPHCNGDVAYSPDNYAIPRNRADVWQITLPTGGGVRIQTTGPTDTVVGLYDAATGQLLAFDEDNGTGGNALIDYTLVGGKTYFLLVAGQNGSAGAYGLEMTGPNQVIDATLAPAPPLYTAAASGSIDQPNQIRYYEAAAPIGATRLGVQLHVASGLNGIVRVEDENHQTVATTAFLAGIGQDDILSNVAITAGEDIFRHRRRACMGRPADSTCGPTSTPTTRASRLRSCPSR